MILSVPIKLIREKIQKQLMQQMALKPELRDEADLEELLAQVEEIASPKVIYRICYVEERTPGAVTIEDVVFHSRALRINLDKIERVFPFIATCGMEAEQLNLKEDDILRQYWLNAIKFEILLASVEHLRQIIQTRYQLENLSIMNPGSGDASVWPIEEQCSLFLLLGGGEYVEQAIGVRLLPSYMMVPEMSTSGIIFSGAGSYYNCQLCQREVCPGRRARFDSNLWERVRATG